MNKQQTQCKRCVMDVSAPEIVFTPTGCNFCDQASMALLDLNTGPHFSNIYLDNTLKLIKRASSDKKYDCLIGLSGGVDSSYALHQAVELGLRPLCFTVDNGWNTTQADENIMKLVETLNVPFYRYVIDLPKFKELQATFMQAGVKNLEIPTDHILMAASFEMAAKHGIKYIISGGNVATESIMPPSWGYNARDLRHIKAIYSRFSGKRLTGLPVCGLLKFNYYKWVKGIRTLYLLDYFDYNRNEAGNLLKEKYGWGETGQKHEESVFTSWFQNFYLFEKFGIDKRKAHYSSMIVSGQMTRDEALARLEESPEYPKLGIENRVVRYPRHEHSDYPTDERLWNVLSWVVKQLRKIGLCIS